MRKPVALQAEDFDAEAGVNYQDMVEDCVEVTLDHLATVDARATAIETATSIDDLNRLFVAPAAAALAEKINRDGLELYKDIYTYVGTAGVTPGTLEDIAAARRQLNLNRAPGYNRAAVWDVEADAKFSTLDALVSADKSGSTKALLEGAIGRVYGIDNYMSQGVCRHKTGITAATALKVNGAVSAGATSCPWTPLPSPASSCAATCSKSPARAIPSPRTAPDAASNAINDIEVAPALEQIADNTEVTLVGDHTANLAFHPMAFAYVTRPLTNPGRPGRAQLRHQL